MATEGFAGLYVETHNYGATAAFWQSLGFESQFETGHGSGQFLHPSGGPYVFIAERPDGPLQLQPILQVADAATFAPSRPPDYERGFEPQHWGTLEALVRDPDGRSISLQAPLPAGTPAPDAHAHHVEKYG